MAVRADKIPQYEYENLARPLIEVVIAYYGDPKNNSELEAWRQERKKKGCNYARTR